MDIPFEPLRNPYQNYVIIKFTARQEGDSVVIAVTGGVPPFRYRIDLSTEESNSTQHTFSRVAPGWHQFEVSDRLDRTHLKRIDQTCNTCFNNIPKTIFVTAQMALTPVLLLVARKVL